MGPTRDNGKSWGARGLAKWAEELMDLRQILEFTEEILYRGRKAPLHKGLRGVNRMGMDMYQIMVLYEAENSYELNLGIYDP